MNRFLILFGAQLLSPAFLLVAPRYAAAQGQPVDTGSHLPVALWAVGTCILGIVIAYGIMRNRTRTRAEKRLTESATKANYAAEQRAEDRT